MPAADAITAVLIYRIISYVFVAAVGWAVIAIMFRTRIRRDDTFIDVVEQDVDEASRGGDSPPTESGQGSDTDPPPDPVR